MSLPVAILAGGKATRLYPDTKTIPKSLVEVAGQPFIFYQLELLRRSGIERVVVCTGFLGEQIERAVGDGSGLGLRVECVPDGPEPLGTGGALRKSAGILGDAFLVLYGDSYLDVDYAQVAKRFLEGGKSGLMTVYKNEGQWDTSNIHFAGGRILAYDKRNPAPHMRHIDYGLGAFRAEAFATWAGGQRFDLEEVYRGLIRVGGLAGLEMTRRFYEIGSPSGLAETRAYLSTRRGKSMESYTRKFLAEVAQVAGALDPDEIEQLAAKLVELRAGGGRLFFLGVGGGAGHASHAVNDFRKLAGIEAYTPTDNVSELTARINDDGWETSFVNWLRVSRLTGRDMVFVFSVGGGDLPRNISPNLVRALDHARQMGATICGIVGRDGGYTAQLADACVIIPTVNAEAVTPHTEAFQAVIWHLLVSHPALRAQAMKWESVRA